MNRTDTIAKNTLFMFIRMVLVAAVGFFSSRIILNTLGVDDFGIYNIVGSIVIFLSFFKTALTNATYRHITFHLGTGDTELLSKTFSMSLNVHVILALILFIVLECIGPWIIENKLNIPVDRIYAATLVFHFSLAVFCIEIIKTPYNSCIIAHEKMNFYALTSIIEALLKLSVVFLLIWLPFDKLVLYSVLLALVSAVMFLWYIVYCNHHFPEAIYHPYWDRQTLRKLSTYAGWSMVVNAADVTVVQCINIFLNIFGGVVVNAAMGVANQVNSLVGSFLHTFSSAFNPQIIKSYAQKDLNYFMKLLFSTSKISFFLFFMAAFPIMLNIDYLLEIWLVNVPKGADIFVCLIFLYTMFDSFSISLWNAVHATGNIKVHQILMASIKILNIPIAYVLLKEGMPIYSAVAIYALLNGVCAIVRIFYLKRLIEFPVMKYCRDVISRMGIVVLITVLLPLWSMHWTMSDLLHLIVSSGIFFTLYAVTVYFLGLNPREKEIVNNILIKRLRHD